LEPRFQIDSLQSLRSAAHNAKIRETIGAWWKDSTSQKVSVPGDSREIAAQVLLAFQLLATPEDKPLLQRLGQQAAKRPETEAQWHRVLGKDGDPQRGERIFFHPQGPRCFACHRIDGRGALIGPDLSTIGHAMKREKLIESIVNPSKEIAPQFTTWQITLLDGKVKTGMIVEEGPNSTISLADSQGKLEVIHRTQVEERRALPQSIMPDKLQDLMTVREFQDLIAYLQQRK
jgi:putative heme-binding domain-containing protein